MTRLMNVSAIASACRSRARNFVVIVPALLLCGILAAGCGENAGQHEGEQAAEDGAHEMESRQLLLFSARTEWFIEYTPMIAGKSSEWLIHLTRLSDGKAAEADAVTLQLRSAKGGSIERQARRQRSGIFLATIPAPETGTVDVRLILAYRNTTDTATATAVPVHATEAAAHRAADEGFADGIAFTREQAWSMEFLVEPVRWRSYPTVLKTTGHLLPHPDFEAEVPATAGGVLTYRASSLVPGQQVRKGEVLATISGAALTSDNLEARIADAEALREKAREDYDRAKLLHADNIISKKSLQEHALRFEQADNALRTLRADVGGSGKSLRAPLSGYVRQIRVPNGAYVREGEAVLSVARNDRILLKAEVYQSDYRLLASIRGASFRTSEGAVFDIRELHGKLRTLGKAVDASAYSVPVYFEIDGRDFIPGGFVDVWLHAGAEVPRLTVPVSALIEDLGKYYVFVQRGGERFEKREVVIGEGDGAVVPIESGLREHERVVTRGVHAVRLAGSAGQVQAHAHDH